MTDNQIRQAEEIINKAKEVGELVFDIEHDPEIGVMSPNFTLWGTSFATKDFEIYLTDLEVIKYVVEQVFPTDVKIINHNIKYDLKCLKKLWGIEYPKNIACTMMALNLIDCTRRENQLGLKVAIKDLYGYQMKTFKEVKIYSKDSKEFKDYGLDDAKWTYKLWKDLEKQLQEQNLEKLFYKILMEGKKLFADIELTGIRWDVKKARELEDLYTKKSEELLAVIQKSIGNDINLNSGDQLSKRLFVDLKWDTKGIGLTEGGKNKAPRLQCNEESLETLAKKYPTAKTILEYRKCKKIIGTYLKPLSELAIKTVDQRLRCSFWLESTTGRTRSNDPINLQNIIKIKDESLSVKQCFNASENFTFGVADMSQIELRLCARISGDANLTKAFTQWKCTLCNTEGESKVILHKCPNCGATENKKVLKGDPGFWHGLDLHQQICENVKVLNNDRELGKQTNFSVVYNATAYKMHWEYPSASVKEWEKIIAGYFEYHPGIYKWHRQTELQIKITKEIKDLFGRKLRFTDQDFQYGKLKHTNNRAINFAPQSSTLHLTLNGVNKIREELIQKGYWRKVFYLTNFVHDEIDYEVHVDYKDECDDIIKRNLETSLDVGVPIRVETAYNKNWHSAKSG